MGGGAACLSGSQPHTRWALPLSLQVERKLMVNGKFMKLWSGCKNFMENVTLAKRGEIWMNG